MPHETKLIALIAIGFVLALALGFLAARLRLPPLIGYLLAGIAVGPYTPGFSADAGLAAELAEIGVMLLMFGVGLHFSVATLWRVRNISLPGALAQIAITTSIGTALASLWGWKLVSGIVFGVSLSIASTVVLLRALEQRNELDTEQGRIAVGWLVVEDLTMVMVLVFLPALADAMQGGEFAASELAKNLALTTIKVAGFVVLMLVGGRRVVPWLLNHVARTGSRELFTLAVLALALGIAYGSTHLFDVSYALGAFFAGVVLAETDLSHQAAENSLPLRDAFAVLFFISVGMLFNPSIIVEQPLAVVSLVFVIVVGKSIWAFLLVLAFGYTIRTAMTIGAGIAQIGEFSFILAGLGIALNVLPAEARDLILAASLLTITLNPLAFATVNTVTAWINAKPALLRRFEHSIRHSEIGADSDSAHMRDHAIIVGYGRVGSIVGHALAAQGLHFVVIEMNRRAIEQLRSQNVAAVYGDATAHGVLEVARIHRARLLVIASPDGFQARRILEIARRKNPQIAIVVRTHSSNELEYLIRQGVDRAVMGELELALEMTEYSLRSLGVSEERSKLVTQWLRTESVAGAPKDPNPS